MRACRFALAILVAAVLLAGAMGAAGPARAQDDAELGALSNDVQRLSEAGKYQEATAVAERYVEIARKRGENSAEFATAIGWLAQVLKDTNRLAEAEPLMRRALAIDEKNFGPEHPNVARDLNNLAQLLQVTNRLAEAEPLMRRALAIDEKSFGPEHPDVATSLNNLAQLLQDTNRLAEAEPLYATRARHRREELRARASQRRQRPQQPGHAAAGHQPAGRGRAALCGARSAIDENEPRTRVIPTSPSASTTWPSCCRTPTGWPRPSRLMRRALAIDEKSFGPEHPNVARRPQQPGHAAAGHQPAR